MFSVAMDNLEKNGIKPGLPPLLPIKKGWLKIQEGGILCHKIDSYVSDNIICSLSYKKWLAK